MSPTTLRITGLAVDAAQADAFANGQRQARESDRVALVTALNLPPETTWAEALARVVPVAKGCHGCKFSDGDTCTQIGPHGSDTRRICLAIRLLTWIDEYTSDYHTPRRGAPECPGRVPK